MKLRTLVARLDNAGDVLLAGPAVRAVAITHEVTLLCSEHGRPAAELLPDVTDIMTTHAPWIDAQPRPVDDAMIRNFVYTVQRRGFDEAAILVSSHQSPLPLALLLRQAGVRRIAAVSHDYAGSLLDVRIPGDPDQHEVERNLAVVGALGHVLPADDVGHLMIRTVRSRALPALAAVARDAVVIHPGASVPARTWPPHQWRALADQLAARGHRIVVTGSRTERSLTASVARPLDGAAIDLGGATDLATLAEVLRAAAVVCCGNTGPMHLAAAVGTPVVAVFPPTVPADRWRPWQTRHELMGRQDIECSGCRSRRCPVPGQPCIGHVAVADVADAVERLAQPNGSIDIAGRPPARFAGAGT
jgi:ADP-heptose:LPS heptosyltransferase